MLRHKAGVGILWDPACKALALWLALREITITLTIQPVSTRIMFSYKWQIPPHSKALANKIKSSSLTDE